MKKYAIYARCASSYQRNAGVSIDKQIQDLKVFAVKNNHEVTNVFLDFGSGNSTKRKGFNEMIQKINEREIDGVICCEIDRLARSMEIVVIVGTLMKKYGIEIITPTQTFNKDNIYLFHMMTAVIEFESHLLSVRTKEGLLSSRLKRS